MPFGSMPSFTESMMTFLKSIIRVSKRPITWSPLSGSTFMEIETLCNAFNTENFAKA